jgi:hypothetical protein
MDYVNIDMRVAPDPEEENHYMVTARTAGRKAQRRFYFSVETWQSVESSLITLGARDAI